MLPSMFGVNWLFGSGEKQTRGPWWPCNAHLSNIALWEPDLELIKANILIKVQNDYNKVFCWFGRDLVFDTKWPSFELNLELIKTNILCKIHDDCLKNVTARVITRFYANLARWPSFWPQVFQFRTWPRNHQDKHFEPDSWWLFQKCYR